MRIYISVDMEGISGVTRWEDVIPSGIDYAQARRWMTDDVNAAIAGARRGGATEFVVEENHGAEMLCVLDLDRIDPDATVIRGMPRGQATTSVALAPGAPPFDGMFLIGHHAMAGQAVGICAHTIYFPHYRRVLCNGRPLGEPEMFVQMAAEQHTPTALIAGDDVVCATVAALCPGVQTAVVKRALTNTAGWIVPPARARPIITAAAERAVVELAAGSIPTSSRRGPYEFEIELHEPIPTERLAMIADHHPEFSVDGEPGDARTVRFRTETMHHGFRCAAIVRYVADLGRVPTY